MASDSINPSTIPLESEEQRKPPPRWLPFTMLVGTGAAIGVPLLLLYRMRRGIVPTTSLKTSSGNATPPPRRATSSTSARAIPSRASVPASSTNATKSSSQPSSSHTKTDDQPNMAFLAAKAFSLATFYVMTGAVVTVLGVKTYLGVENTEQFAREMRRLMAQKLPSVTQRINRPFERADNSSSPSSLVPSSESTGSTSTSTMSTDFSTSSEEGEWSWESAETRLRQAYDTQGASGWFSAALREMELEGEAVRRKKREELEKDERKDGS